MPHEPEREVDDALRRTANDARARLWRERTLHPAAISDELAFPASFRRTLARALAEEGGAGPIADHYLERMPRMRVAQLEEDAAPHAAVFHAALDWARLPRLAAAIDRLYGELAAAGVDGEGAARALGAPSAEAWRARSPTLASAYARTYYGGAMPLLHGQAADLAYFLRRAGARGLDLHGAIDRYLTAPLVHELCHFGRDRAAIEPIHLDECIGGWLCARVLPELAFPAAGEDDAIYATPWLAQVGLAIAHAFGAGPTIAAHAGARVWASATSPAFVAAAARLGWDDWCARRPLHLLCDVLDPLPWIALAFAAARGMPVADATLAGLRELSLHAVAPAADPAADRAVVAEALRAMCLEGFVGDGTLRTRAALPAGPIAVDAVRCVVTSPRRGVDTADPLHWIPPAAAHPVRVHLARLDAIPAAAAALCAGAVGDGDGFAITR
ncbi:MAG: hypothetical protein KIT31_41910 [Deltaproteobacteria bacterium]|nr:hypothetical protein [Deltaproteobacteria bacterium]